jgi:nucleotide-binding universal stress UspA family protein
MKNIRYKILVLSDLKKSTATMLESTVSLAKMIGGDISLFHVKNPSDLVKKESQLSAIRSMNHEHTAMKKKIKKLATSFSEEYGTKMNCSFTFGHIKNEIEAHIKREQPDIIILGKKNSRSFDFIGDNITQFILKQYNGVVMIVDENNTIKPSEDLSLGLFNSEENKLNINFADVLVSNMKKPLKSFKVNQKNPVAETKNTSLDKKVVEYVFERGDDALKHLSNYLVKNKINLLHVDRADKSTSDSKEITTVTFDIKDIISNLNVSLLLTGTSKFA